MARLFWTAEELKIIFASDERRGTKLVRNLLAEAYKISHDYSKRFNGDGAKIIKGVVPSAVSTFGGLNALGKAAGLVLNAGATAANVALGLFKVNEATPDFTERFGRVIASTAEGVKFRTKDMCDEIIQLDLGEFEEQAQAISSSCEKIAALMSDQTMMPLRDNLLEHLKGIVFLNAGGMIKSEVLSPVANFAGSDVGEMVRDSIEKSQLEEEAKAEIEKQFKKMQERAKEAQAKAYKSEAGKTPKAPTDPANDNSKQYRVQPGDTLSGIAKKSGISEETLLAANPHIKDPNKIYHGAMLNVPAGGATSAAPSSQASKTGTQAADKAQSHEQNRPTSHTTDATSGCNANQADGKEEYVYIRKVIHMKKLDKDGKLESGIGHFYTKLIKRNKHDGSEVPEDGKIYGKNPTARFPFTADSKIDTKENFNQYYSKATESQANREKSGFIEKEVEMPKSEFYSLKSYLNSGTEEGRPYNVLYDNCADGTQRVAGLGGHDYFSIFTKEDVEHMNSFAARDMALKYGYKGEAFLVARPAATKTQVAQEFQVDITRIQEISFTCMSVEDCIATPNYKILPSKE